MVPPGSRLQIRNRAARARSVGEASIEPITAAALSVYVAEMTSELATLAKRAQLPMLAYFLNLARVEAEERAHQLGGAPVRRRPRDSV